MQEIEKILKKLFIYSLYKAIKEDEDIKNSSNPYAHPAVCYHMYNILKNYKNRSVIEANILVLSLLYIETNNDEIVNNLKMFINDISKLREIFFNNDEFGIKLITNYANYIGVKNVLSLTSIIQKYGFFINVEHIKEKKQEVKLIDEVVKEAFINIKNAISTSIKDYYQIALIIVNGKNKHFINGNFIGKESIDTFISYYDYFIKMMYAEIYAGILSGVLHLEENILEEFDRHIIEEEYTVNDYDYEVKLMCCYMVALDYKYLFELNDNDYTCIRKINPLYHL